MLFDFDEQKKRHEIFPQSNVMCKHRREIIVWVLVSNDDWFGYVSIEA